jgi:hemerythrin
MARVKEDCLSENVGLGFLNEEHSEIYRSFLALDEAIAHGHGLPQILTAAEDLSQLMLRHFIHEVQFLEKVSYSTLRSHRAAEMATMVGIQKADSGLRQRELSAALLLRNLCRQWLHRHLYEESDMPGLFLEATEKPGLEF